MPELQHNKIVDAIYFVRQPIISLETIPFGLVFIAT